MTVVLDTTFLLHFLAPADEVGSSVPFAKERVAGLIAELEKSQTTIIVPTPALSEIMVRAGVEAGQEYVSILKRSGVVRIVPFDEKAAIETAIMAGDVARCPAIRPATAGTAAKIKFDRQIVAIAVTEGAKKLYTDDKNLTAFAKRHRLMAVGMADCPVPTSDAQGSLDLKAPHNL